jgi:hypothetical protein
MDSSIYISCVLCLLLLTAPMAESQNSQIGWFSFDAGSGAPTVANTAVRSVLGQTGVGVMRGAENVIVSGFLAGTLGRGIPVGTGDTPPLPQVFSLGQNYPNPFNPATTIAFSLPAGTAVTLKVYNILGEEVAALLNNDVMPPGVHHVVFSARQCASGVYLYRLTTHQFTGTKRMLLLK